ncbi:sugar phosphate isomerase/epimerase family protein [Meiothermus granaticius]|uniref:L-ribulose 3-epimerase n=1 Tax=Meiothermus granaticius NBRC 107808 TaxID=1227551 RepID=A0A399F4H2_9DEIN|nr:sugar phosphate isomerase/epimerase family protein [Meiothermus granaticius]RIH90983.1 L-ribulose 3-epimerase [Meiothermus granaticius NBRC 107808]GEM87503.1 tagatose 3-epimerase [Meiothermus granaticius NBRC 107808]
MARFGAHAFIWSADWTPQAAEKVAAGAAAAGLDFVEIPLLRPEAFDSTLTRRLLEHHGLGCTCSLGLPTEAALPDHPQAAARFLIQALDVAHQMGSPVLSGVTYATLGALSGRPPTEADYETLAKTLKPVAQHAARLGMRLGLEPVNRYETYLINLGSQALDLIQRIGEPNVFVHLDTYHMNIEEKGFKNPIVTVGKHLGYIHLSESDRGTPGSGNVHWDEVFSGLQAIGFQGDLVMESFVALNPDIARATCMWRDVVGDPKTLVHDGLAFLRGKAREYGLL